MRRARSVLGSSVFGAAIAIVTCTSLWVAFTDTSLAAGQRSAISRRTFADRARAFADAGDRRLPYLPGEVLVKFRAGTTSARRQRALLALRSRPSLASLRWSGDLGWMRDESEPDAIVLARQLAGQPEVEFAQPNYIRRVPAVAGPYRALVFDSPAGVPSAVPNDPDYPSLQWNFTLLDMPAAWAINPGGKSSLTVAVLDTGLTTVDTVRTFRLWTGAQFENVSVPFSVSPDISASRFTGALDLAFFVSGAPVLDFSGHGTHVASTIAEDANNARQLAGMAYGVSIMPVKVCVGYWEVMVIRGDFNVPGFIPSDTGGCADEDVAAGIRYAADAGAKVINLSISGSSPAPALRDAMVYAVNRGSFVAVAGGNDFLQGNLTQYPASYAQQIDGAMAVGSVGKSETRAYYSNIGNYIEIAAPGGSDRDGGGDDRGYIWQVTLHPSDSAPSILRPVFDRYVAVGYEGSSMSAPHVAGLGALLMSQGNLRPAAVEMFIKATAKDLGAPGRDDEFGAGLVQPRLALRGLGIAR